MLNLFCIDKSETKIISPLGAHIVKILHGQYFAVCMLSRGVCVTTPNSLIDFVRPINRSVLDYDTLRCKLFIFKYTLSVFHRRCMQGFNLVTCLFRSIIRR